MALRSTILMVKSTATSHAPFQLKLMALEIFTLEMSVVLRLILRDLEPSLTTREELIKLDLSDAMTMLMDLNVAQSSKVS